MSPLEEDIHNVIRLEGPMSVSRYMNFCLSHPVYGYYMTRDPLGARGDFITAPEISQVFGECLGLWAASAWQAMGEPEVVNLIELGPGRGTLMADLLRTARVLPGFAKAIRVQMVEVSPVLKQKQQAALKLTPNPVGWHQRLEDVPEGASILIANEFLDCLPIRQILRGPRGFHERLVGLSEDKLAFGLSPDALPDQAIPAFAQEAEEGDLIEFCPGLADVALTLAKRAKSGPLAACFIDYGHEVHGSGETLQALRAHDFADPLLEPGEADLTAHVDFALFSEGLRAVGLDVSPVISQADFLSSLGIYQRAEQLVKAQPQRGEEIVAAVSRLMARGETGMGDLFKAVMVGGG